MVTNDATILRLKHDVLYEVAKAAWEGKLEEESSLFWPPEKHRGRSPDGEGGG